MSDSPKVTVEITQRQSDLATAIARRTRSATPQPEDATLQSAQENLAALVDAIDADEPGLFAERMAWSKSVLDHRGRGQELISHLRVLREVLGEQLTNHARKVAVHYVDAALRRVPDQTDDPPTCIDPRSPLYQLAQEYLDALLRNQRNSAMRLIEDAVASGASIEQIYLDVFQQCQYEIGRLWQLNQISVAQEHYATAATQMIMSRLYPSVFATPRNGRTIIATCAAGDVHNLGIRMVSDFFEMHGYTSLYLGASTPATDLAAMVAQHAPDIVAISVSALPHIRRATEMIARIRDLSLPKPPKLLVGGQPFRLFPDLHRKIQADATALTAPAAIKLARTWFD
ncbi:MAG TPA: cobalamin-dependent protein [Tepidisphaeraceae bacterium]|jgi:methanogenic corrinoid protein MtbC1